VQERVALPVCGDMEVALAHAHVAERGVEIVSQGLVVVPRDIENIDAVPGEAQELLHHRVMAYRPVHDAPERPEIDDIAEQEYHFAFVPLEKGKQALGLACARAEMDVREEQRANADHGVACTLGFFAIFQVAARLGEQCFGNMKAREDSKKKPV
jgi:hypothetical protein